MLRKIIDSIINSITKWSANNVTHYYYTNGNEVITIGHQLLLESQNQDMETQVTGTSVAIVRKPKTYYAVSGLGFTVNPRVTKKGNVVLSWKNGPRMTIAIYMPNPTSVVYGITICSSDDVFVVKEGRKRARERMNMGMFARSINPAYIDLNEEDIVKKVCEEVIQSFHRNPRKMENKIAEFNKKHREVENPS